MSSERSCVYIWVSTSYEGIEALTVIINAGTINITSTDDAINMSIPTASVQAWGGQEHALARDEGVGGTSPPAQTTQIFFPLVMMYSAIPHLFINGGNIVIDASGDGIDSNGDITMSNGLVIIHGPTENTDGAIDYDGTFRFTGGLLVAVGSVAWARAPSETSTQNALLLNFASVQQAGQIIHIQNSTGEGMLTFAPRKVYQSLTFASAEIRTGETYQVYLGDSAMGSESNGLYDNAAYTPGNLSTTFTVSRVISQIEAVTSVSVSTGKWQ